VNGFLTIIHKYRRSLRLELKLQVLQSVSDVHATELALAEHMEEVVALPQERTPEDCFFLEVVDKVPAAMRLVVAD
jgi:hypothetical protein